MKTVSKNLIFPVLVCFYPLLLMVSNITGVKLNHPFALVIILFAFHYTLSSARVFIPVLIGIQIILLKYLIYGTFFIKEMVVLLLGPVIFLKYIYDFDKCSEVEKKNIFKIVVSLSFFVSLIVLLQFLDLLPMTLGRMDFLNVVGVNIFGEYDDSFRPSAYFYHPYDTSLVIVPFIFYSIIKISNNIGLKASVLIFLSIIAVYSLQLKVMFGFYVLILFYVLYGYRFKISKFIFLIVGIFLTIQVIYFGSQNYSQEEIAVSAGRLLIWKINYEHLLDNISIQQIIFGSWFNPLEQTSLWISDEFFTVHNLYLSLIVNAGLVLSLLFVYLKSQMLGKDRVVDYAIVCMMCTLAFTGDLMVFTSYWVCVCFLYVLSSDSKKYPIASK